MALALCPNCHQRPPEVAVDFDEVLKSRYSVSRSRTQGIARSFSSKTRYGQAHLCASCAAGYRRMVRWRAMGWKLANWGLLSLIVTGVFFAFVWDSTALKGSWLAYGAGGLFLLTILVLLAGSILVSGARLMRRSAARFVLRPTK